MLDCARRSRISRSWMRKASREACWLSRGNVSYCSRSCMAEYNRENKYGNHYIPTCIHMYMYMYTVVLDTVL